MLIGMLAGVVAGPAAASTLYATSLNAEGDDLLIQIDPATGQVQSSIGVSAGIFGPWPFATNIAFAPNGKLFGTSLNASGDDLLIEIDPATGQVLSSTGVSAGIFGPWPFGTDIAFASNGDLYGTSLNAAGQDLLIQIDPATGQVLSSIGVSAGIFGPWPFATNIAIAPNGKLFGTSLNAAGDDLLIEIDPATGQVLSSTGVSAGIFGPWPFDTDIAFAPDGTLYGTSLNAEGDDLLIQIDPATGQVQSSTGVSAGIFGPWPFATDIAFVPAQSVPEPGTLPILALGAVGVLGLMRRRKAP